MKNLLLTLSIMTIAFSVGAQALTRDKVPVLVLHAFNAKYPLAIQENWQLSEPNIYKVEFTNAKLNHTASFDKTGKWLRTDTKISGVQVPTDVNRSILTELEGYTIKSISMVEVPDRGVTYVFATAKGSESGYVVYSAKGERISAGN